MTKFDSQKADLAKALLRLEEVLQVPKSAIVRDSAIQRFEFCVDLSWKTVKTYLEEEKGIVVNSPKEVFKESYTQAIIEYDTFWLEIVDMRNLTSHTYKEELAEKIYQELPKVLSYLKILQEKIASS